jgi:hypothetical protein
LILPKQVLYAQILEITRALNTVVVVQMALQDQHVKRAFTDVVKLKIL